MSKDYTFDDITDNIVLELDVLLLSFEEAKDKNDKLFHRAIFIDLDKKKSAIVAFNKSSSLFETYLGKPVNATIQGNVFNGNLTYKLININKPSDKDISLFCEDNKKIAKDNYNNTIKLINQIQDKALKELVLKIYKKYEYELHVYPAGKSFHHSEFGGLIRHTYNVTKLVISFAEQYNLNKDLLIAAGALHDIGKVKELIVEHNNIMLTETNYSDEGNLCGHLELGVEIILENITDLEINQELLMLLKHLILSHHGKLKYKSVTLPSTLEAYTLFIADNLDSKLDSINDTYSQILPGETAIDPFLSDEDTTHLYKPKI